MSSTERPTRESGEFASQVNRMFDRIAGHYDAMNSVMTAGLHHRWRQRAADRTELGPGDAALDVWGRTAAVVAALGTLALGIWPWKWVQWLLEATAR